jgi:hypothetical protein
LEARLRDPNIVEKNDRRCSKLVRDAIRTFELNLSGLVVLTEGATGYYVLTPLIAALAGAERVYALTKDSRYGSADAVSQLTMALADRWGLADRINVLFSRVDERVGLADIITNLGFVRPLDASFLRRLKKNAVIPLMFETWEFREADLNLMECRRLGIPVLGTNEHHPKLRTFEYIGLIAMKLLFEIGVEIFQSNIVVIGSGEFAEQVILSLRLANGHVTFLSTAERGCLVSSQAREALKEAEAVIVVGHHSHKVIIGTNGEIEARELSAMNPHLAVVHICGAVEQEALESLHIRCHPSRFAPPGHMSVTTDYLGPKALIDLHTAGLKIGEELARARERGFAGQGAESFVLQKTSLGQPFQSDSLKKGLE